MNQENIYELIIIGGGPAGCSAAVYAARKRLKTLMILNEWGGQSIVSDDIQNWIGTPHISGHDLAENLKKHVLEYKSNNHENILNIKENTLVKNINPSPSLPQGKGETQFEIETMNGEKYLAKSVLIATGSNRKKLEVKGADIFEHKGLTYCATCDGPLFSDMPVVVIGGGNAGFESASQLLAYCSSVVLLSRGEPRAEEITISRLSQNPKFKLIKNAIPKEIHGETFVNGLTYTDKNLNQDIKINVSAVFVEIGQTPSTSFAKEICDLSPTQNIKINPLTQETSTKGIWAAGDCSDVLYHQNNIAAGDAVKAIEDIYKFLRG